MEFKQLEKACDEATGTVELAVVLGGDAVREVLAEFYEVVAAHHGPSADAPWPEVDAAAAQVKCFALPVVGVMGMDGAQVTAGGIRTAEFDPVTLESRLAPGVFATGEVLDVDGECGGFNLHWAWSSGCVAGKLGKREDEA